MSWSKNVVHLHNGILHRIKKEGTPTFCGSMDGTVENYAEWNAEWNTPVGERQIPYNLTYKRNLMNKIKLKNEQNGMAFEFALD